MTDDKDLNSHIKNSLKNLTIGSSLEKTQANIIEFEKCENCYDNSENLNYCHDTIKKLLRIRVSSKKTNALINHIYKIRSLNIKLIELDQYFFNSDFYNLKKIFWLQHDSEITAEKNSEKLLDQKRFEELNKM